MLESDVQYTQYAYMYGDNPNVYYVLSASSGNPTEMHILEDFIDDIIKNNPMDSYYSDYTCSIYNESQSTLYHLSDDELHEIADGYDLKVVACYQEYRNNMIAYKLFIKDNSWCILDPDENAIAGAWRWGMVIKDCFLEVTRDISPASFNTDTPGLINGIEIN